MLLNMIDILKSIKVKLKLKKKRKLSPYTLITPIIMQFHPRLAIKEPEQQRSHIS